jgi:hypothetical protein
MSSAFDRGQAAFKSGDGVALAKAIVDGCTSTAWERLLAAALVAAERARPAPRAATPVPPARADTDLHIEELP